MAMDKTKAVEAVIGAPPLDIDPNSSLVNHLDQLYHAFHIDNYLDQIGLIDDKIDRIADSLKDLIHDAFDLTEEELQDRLIAILHDLDHTTKG